MPHASSRSSSRSTGAEDDARTSAALRAHWTLDPAVRFLNHGSFGACPRVVLDVQAELRAEIEREPVLFLHREAEARLDAAKRALARFLGCDAHDLAKVTNATTGVNTVLASLDLEAGDEILITDHGYPACNNAARRIVERAGARLAVARVPFPLGSSDAVVDAVLGALTPRTRVLVIDHVTSPTGLVFPLERIVPAVKQRGVLVFVDGAHAPGMVALDLERLGADFYTGNCHKWLCAPKGAAFLWVAREHQPRIRPLVTSHGASSTRTDRSRFELEFDWTGTEDPTPFLCVPAALEFLGELFPGGWDELRARNRALALEGRALLCDALGVDAPAPEELIGSLASVPLPDSRPGAGVPLLQSESLHQELFDRHRIEVPVMPWPGPPKRLLRIAAQAYVAREEIAALAEVLRAGR
jgi:isopenicillin-N epimerase